MRQFVLLTAAAIVAGGYSTQASAQRVVRASNGELNVVFPGACTVHYNRYIQIEKVDRSCTAYQRSYAERLIAPYRNQQYPGYPGTPGYPGHPGYPGQPGYGVGQYRITDIRYDRVRFADNCRVYYNWLGRYLRSKGSCNTRQRQMADRAMYDWRRNSGYYPGGGGWRPGGSWNDVMLLPSYDGGLHVRFANGCDVYYDIRRLRIRQDRSCTIVQIQRADAAARYHAPGIRD